MKITTVVSCLCFAAASLSAQSYLQLPATANPANELPNYSIVPLMQVNSRQQLFYSAAEVGQSTFTANQLELRFDGPVPQVGAPGPFVIQRLQILVGSTSVAMPEARFAANLSQPLTTVFDGPHSFFPDPGFAAPHPWGGPNNSLVFPFLAPVSVTIPAGGWFVVELVMEGNNIANLGYSHAMVDGANTTGGVVNGSASNFGAGCAAGAGPAPTIGSSGVLAPGAAHFVTGQNLGANAPVFAIFGLSNTTSALGQLPYQLSGTNCSLLVSPDLTSLLFADAAGAIPANQPGAALPIPATNAFQGLMLFEQLAAWSPGANPWDIVVSDGLFVTLGSIQPLGRGTYTVQNGESAFAPVAIDVKPFGLAMRLRTQ